MKTASHEHPSPAPVPVPTLTAELEKTARLEWSFPVSGLSPESVEILHRQAEALNLTPGELVMRILRAGCAGEPPPETPPAEAGDGGHRERLETPDERLSVLLPKAARARLERHAAALGCGAGALAAFLLKLECGRKTRPSPPSAVTGGLRLKARQRRRLESMARLLGIGPKRFLRWQVSDLLRGMENPDTGTLTDWTDGLIRYATAREKAAAVKRVDAWRERRRAKDAKDRIKAKALPAAGD